MADLENKKVFVGEFHNRSEAIQVYNESKERYIYKSLQKNKITNY
jgi:inorganic pyrophosphatase